MAASTPRERSPSTFRRSARWRGGFRRPGSPAADTAFAAHKEAPAAAARGAHPGEGGWSRENLAWLLARTGPVGAARFGELAGCSHHAVLKQGGFHEVSTDLFPPQDVVISYRLLFGVYSGIVPDGIEDLATGDIDWAGDASVLLSYVKRRRPGLETAVRELDHRRRGKRLRAAASQGAALNCCDQIIGAARRGEREVVPSHCCYWPPDAQIRALLAAAPAALDRAHDNLDREPDGDQIGDHLAGDH